MKRSFFYQFAYSILYSTIKKLYPTLTNNADPTIVYLYNR